MHRRRNEASGRVPEVEPASILSKHVRRVLHTAQGGQPHWSQHLHQSKSKRMLKRKYPFQPSSALHLPLSLYHTSILSSVTGVSVSGVTLQLIQPTLLVRCRSVICFLSL